MSVLHFIQNFPPSTLDLLVTLTQSLASSGVSGIIHTLDTIQVWIVKINDQSQELAVAGPIHLVCWL
jgi:hypothetical protein